MIRFLAQIAAAVVFAIIVYATLSPIQLRPQTGYVGLEREAAFALFGAVLMLAFPDQPWAIVAAIVAIAVGLELTQRLTRDRHGKVLDAVQKIVGGMVGCALGYLISQFANL